MGVIDVVEDVKRLTSDEESKLEVLESSPDINGLKELLD